MRAASVTAATVGPKAVCIAGVGMTGHSAAGSPCPCGHLIPRCRVTCNDFVMWLAADLLDAVLLPL